MALDRLLEQGQKTRLVQVQLLLLALRSMGVTGACISGWVLGSGVDSENAMLYVSVATSLLWHECAPARGGRRAGRACSPALPPQTLHHKSCATRARPSMGMFCTKQGESEERDFIRKKESQNWAWISASTRGSRGHTAGRCGTVLLTLTARALRSDPSAGSVNEPRQHASSLMGTR
jgi:hypothetical protein